jgi:anti-anti-sigma regulatory factor
MLTSPKLTATPPLTPVDLDAVDAARLARTLARQPRRPQLLVDCAQLQCLRTLGVSHVVSQLLVLRRGGAHVWLRNADPALRRCLQLLQLDPLISFAD